ncbi:MAG: hypothetical protein D6746_14750 [Bacteroidetes bacterium]|nr:MAG: hypothetical protein D6746_14750 [Bacteroidota bacterium]
MDDVGKALVGGAFEVPGDLWSSSAAVASMIEGKTGDTVITDAVQQMAGIASELGDAAVMVGGYQPTTATGMHKVIEGAARSAPLFAAQVGAGVATSAVTGGAAIPALLVFAGTGAAPVVGQVYQEALEETGDEFGAAVEALEAGLWTYATEAMLGKLGELVPSPKVRQILGESIRDVSKRFVGRVARGGVGEFTQESLDQLGQEVLAEFNRRANTGNTWEDIKQSLARVKDKDVQTAALYAGLSGGILGAGGGGVVGGVDMAAQARVRRQARSMSEGADKILETYESITGKPYERAEEWKETTKKWLNDPLNNDYPEALDKMFKEMHEAVGKATELGVDGKATAANDSGIPPTITGPGIDSGEGVILLPNAKPVGPSVPILKSKRLERETDKYDARFGAIIGQEFGGEGTQVYIPSGEELGERRLKLIEEFRKRGVEIRFAMPIVRGETDTGFTGLFDKVGDRRIVWLNPNLTPGESEQMTLWHEVLHDLTSKDYEFVFGTKEEREASKSGYGGLLGTLYDVAPDIFDAAIRETVRQYGLPDTPEARRTLELELPSVMAEIVVKAMGGVDAAKLRRALADHANRGLGTKIVRMLKRIARAIGIKVRLPEVYGNNLEHSRQIVEAANLIYTAIHNMKPIKGNFEVNEDSYEQSDQTQLSRRKKEATDADAKIDEEGQGRNVKAGVETRSVRGRTGQAREGSEQGRRPSGRRFIHFSSAEQTAIEGIKRKFAGTGFRDAGTDRRVPVVHLYKEDTEPEREVEATAAIKITVRDEFNIAHVQGKDAQEAYAKALDEGLTGRAALDRMVDLLDEAGFDGIEDSEYGYVQIWRDIPPSMFESVEKVRSTQFSKKKEIGRVPKAIRKPLDDATLERWAGKYAKAMLSGKHWTTRKSYNSFLDGYKRVPKKVREGYRQVVGRARHLLNELSREARKGRPPELAGAPPKIRTLEDAERQYQELKAMALKGAAGRFWYDRSSQAILTAAGGNRDHAIRIANLLAAFSPQTPVWQNWRYAIMAFNRWKAGKRIDGPDYVGRNPEHAKNAQEYMYEGKEWAGRKRNSFFINLMPLIDPSLEQGVTIDMHMMRAFGYGDKVPTSLQYDYAEGVINRIAKELGWKPYQVQAAIWHTIKHESDGTDISKTYDFSHAMMDNIALVTYEAIPHRSTNVLPGLHDADWEIKEEYTEAVTKVLYDDDGVDKLAEAIGLLQAGVFTGTGVYEGEFTPGRQAAFTVPPEPRTTSDQAVIQAEAKEMLDLYASMLGVIYRQQAVAYHRPFYVKNPVMKRANMHEFIAGRMATKEETAAFERAVAERMGDAAWETAIVPVADGLRLLHVPSLEDLPRSGHTEWHKVMAEIAAEVLPPEFQDVTFAYWSGNYIDADDGGVNGGPGPYGGGAFQVQASPAGSPDVQRTGNDILRKVQEINEYFSEKYDLGDPGSFEGFQFSRRERPQRERGRDVAGSSDRKMMEDLARRSGAPPPSVDLALSLQPHAGTSVVMPVKPRPSSVGTPLVSSDAGAVIMPPDVTLFSRRRQYGRIPRLHSQLIEAVRNAPFKRAPWKQWLGYLRRPELGIRQAELDWLRFYSEYEVEGVPIVTSMFDQDRAYTADQIIEMVSREVPKIVPVIYVNSPDIENFARKIEPIYESEPTYVGVDQAPDRLEKNMAEAAQDFERRWRLFEATRDRKPLYEINVTDYAIDDLEDIRHAFVRKANAKGVEVIEGSYAANISRAVLKALQARPRVGSGVAAVREVLEVWPAKPDPIIIIANSIAHRMAETGDYSRVWEIRRTDGKELVKGGVRIEVGDPLNGGRQNDYSVVVGNRKIAKHKSFNDATMIAIKELAERDRDEMPYPRTLVAGEPEYSEPSLRLPGPNRLYSEHLLIVSGSGVPKVQNQHWFEDNVAAHIRTTVRPAEDGGEAFFVDELQSDWFSKYQKLHRDRIKHRTAANQTVRSLVTRRIEADVEEAERLIEEAGSRLSQEIHDWIARNVPAAIESVSSGGKGLATTLKPNPSSGSILARELAPVAYGTLEKALRRVFGTKPVAEPSGVIDVSDAWFPQSADEVYESIVKAGPSLATTMDNALGGRYELESRVAERRQEGKEVRSYLARLADAIGLSDEQADELIAYLVDGSLLSSHVLSLVNLAVGDAGFDLARKALASGDRRVLRAVAEYAYAAGQFGYAKIRLSKAYKQTSPWPFDTYEGWVGLAMKYALQRAVSNTDAKYFAWTTGEQQRELNGRQVSSVISRALLTREYGPNFNGWHVSGPVYLKGPDGAEHTRFIDVYEKDAVLKLIPDQEVITQLENASFGETVLYKPSKTVTPPNGRMYETIYDRTAVKVVNKILRPIGVKVGKVKVEGIGEVHGLELTDEARGFIRSNSMSMWSRRQFTPPNVHAVRAAGSVLGVHEKAALDFVRGSAAADVDGTPIVLYQGGPPDSQMQGGRVLLRGDYFQNGPGIYMSDVEEVAKQYAALYKGKVREFIMSMRHPLDLRNENSQVELHALETLDRAAGEALRRIDRVIRWSQMLTPSEANGIKTMAKSVRSGTSFLRDIYSKVVKFRHLLAAGDITLDKVIIPQNPTHEQEQVLMAVAHQMLAGFDSISASLLAPSSSNAPPRGWFKVFQTPGAHELMNSAVYEQVLRDLLVEMLMIERDRISRRFIRKAKKQYSDRYAKHVIADASMFDLTSILRQLGIDGIIHVNLDVAGTIAPVRPGERPFDAGRIAAEYGNSYIVFHGGQVNEVGGKYDTTTHQFSRRDLPARPDLANPGSTMEARELIDQVDEERNRQGRPPVVPDDAIKSEALAKLDKDEEKWRKDLYDMIRNGVPLGPVETYMAKTLADRLAQRAIQNGDEESMEMAIHFADAYRESGTSQARAFRMRHDEMMSPEERLQHALTSVLTLPGPKARRALRSLNEKIRHADNERDVEILVKRRDEVLRQQARELSSIREDLAASGLDPRTLTPSKMAVPGMPQRIARVVSTHRASTSDKLFELYLSMILSGPLTHAANTLGNTINASIRFGLLRPTEALVNLVVGDPKAPQVGELVHLYGSMWEGITRGVAAWMRAYTTEQPQFEADYMPDDQRSTKLELFEGRQAIKGVKGRVIRFPSLTSLLAFDELFKAIGGTMEAHAMAYRLGKARGLSGARLNRFIDVATDPITSSEADPMSVVDKHVEEFKNIFDIDLDAAAIMYEQVRSEVREHAMRSAKQMTFQDEPSVIGQAALEIRRIVPGLRWLIPFVSVPDRIFGAGLKLTPLGSIQAFSRAVNTGLLAINFKQQGGVDYRLERDTLVTDLAYSILGWGLFGLLWALVSGYDDEPFITGSADIDYAKRGAQYRTAPPMSVRVGDKWYSYRRLEPAAVSIATTVDLIKEAKKAMDTDGSSSDAVLDALSRAASSISDQMSDKTFLRGLGDIITILMDDSRRASTLAKVGMSFTTAWVPNLIKQPLRNLDRNIRDTTIRKQDDDGWWGGFKSNLKFAALPLEKWAPPPRVDIWGRDIERGDPFSGGVLGAMWRVGVPINVYDADKTTRLDMMIAAYNRKYEQGLLGPDAEPLYPRPPQAYVRRKSIEFRMTDDEYHRLMREGGRMATERLLKMRLNYDDPGVKEYNAVKDAFRWAYGQVRDQIVRDRLAAKRMVNETWTTP